MKFEKKKYIASVICAVPTSLLRPLLSTCPDNSLCFGPRHRGAGISTLNRGYVTATSVPLNYDDMFPAQINDLHL